MSLPSTLHNSAALLDMPAFTRSTLTPFRTSSKTLASSSETSPFCRDFSLKAFFLAIAAALILSYLDILLSFLTGRTTGTSALVAWTKIWNYLK